jgi:hypothetical protein
VKANFEELFLEMYRASIPFEVAQEFIRHATTAHMPDGPTIKNTYRNTRSGTTEKEFVDRWKKGIKDFCVQSFHVYYNIPIEGEIKEPVVKEEVDKHVERLRKFSKPLTAAKFAEILASRKQIEEEDNE